MHVRQSRVLLLFLEAVENFRFPALRELFERAHIQVAVVQIGFQFGHELNQKSAILADGVAAEGRVVFRNVLFDESQNLRFCIFLSRGGCFDFVNQAAASMGPFVPGIHFVQELIALVNDANRALYAGAEVGASDNHSDLQQTLFFRVESRHFTVDPNQIVIRLGQCCVWALGREVCVCVRSHFKIWLFVKALIVADVS
ncbi:MAG: hypothetical protein RJB45_559 [Pseudomonadota bacterium]|jgi:hypothetical protein